MDDKIVCGEVCFFELYNDTYSKSEKEEMFKNLIKEKGILHFQEICGSGDLLNTTIYLKDDKLFIHKTCEDEDWFQEGIYLDESQLLQLIDDYGGKKIERNNIPQYNWSYISGYMNEFNNFISKYTNNVHCFDKNILSKPQLNSTDVDSILINKLLKIETALGDFLETQKTFNEK